MPIASLPLFHRIAGKPVIVVGKGDAAEAKRRLVERAGGVAVGEDDERARLAFVACEAPQQAAESLRARGVLVNVVDRPELCDFTVPSILDRDPVLVAIGTSGASAGLAKALRLRLEGLLPQALGRLASALGAAREKLRDRWPDPGERRQALDAALGESGPLDPMREESAGRLAEWLEQGGPEPIPGAVVEFTIRSDDPDDLTLRQARLLGSADILAYDSAVAQLVVDRARADARRVVLAPGAAPPFAEDGLVVVLRRA